MWASSLAVFDGGDVVWCLRWMCVCRRLGCYQAEGYAALCCVVYRVYMFSFFFVVIYEVLSHVLLVGRRNTGVAGHVCVSISESHG